MNNINILLYHQIGRTPNAHTNLDCFCSSEQFYSQMEFLANSDYEVISLSNAMNLIFNQKTINAKYVVLTFDDGCEKFYDITFPILTEFNFPSTIYPVAGFFGKHATWGKINNPELKILSKTMLVELHQLGVDIGAHTINHVKLTQISKEDATKQIKGSKETIEQLLGENIYSFAYPHGDFNDEIIEIVKEVEFSNALTCISGYAEEAQSEFKIPRKYITYFDDLNKFKQKLK
jgi:peptidoglycan/xylan/chitin deacetylase (PgdA/CDA1 family)